MLAQRGHDLAGRNLAPPGRGWQGFLRYLLETRTVRETVYADPAAFNSELGKKALHLRQPSAFYERVDAPFQPLSAPLERSIKGRSFVEAMHARRTARRFADEPISESELSRLLYFGWGMTDHVANPMGDVFVRKTAPSGGSLHPVEVYPLVMNVAGVAPGCYHYSVRRHGLETVAEGQPRDWIAAAAGDQHWVEEAAVIFLCTAFLPRSAWKYGFSRVGRVILAEIGYTGQSALLAASWMGLGAFTTMALRDEIFEDRLGLDPLREPVLSITGAGQLETDVTDHARPRSESAGASDG